MKKKLMMVAVLLGALSLGACVDNNESASVEAVRNAKAEQLKGLAALANAQAEATKITAEAEAALKNAQAEYQKEMTEEAKQEFAVEIERIKAEAERAIAEAKKAASEAELAILKNADERVQWLYGQYTTAADELATLNENLLTKTAGLAQLEAGITTAEANAKVNTIALNRTIAAETAKLEVLKDPANTNIDKDALNAKKEAAYQKYTLAYSTLMNNEGAALDADAKGIQEAIDALDRDAIEAVNNLYSNVVAFTGYEYLSWETTSGSTSRSLPSGAYVSEAQKLNAENYFATNLEDAANALGTSADTKDKNTAYGRLAAANAQLEDANKMGETTDAEKEAKKQAMKNNLIGLIDQTYPNANTAIALAKDEIVRAQASYDEEKAASDEFTAALAAVDVKAYNDAVSAIVALVKANETVAKAFNDANETPMKLWNEYSVLNTLYNNSQNLEELIAQCDYEIAYAKEQIKFYEANITNAEAQLAKGKEELANLEKEIAAKKIIVDNAKAALDAELNAE